MAQVDLSNPFPTTSLAEYDPLNSRDTRNQNKRQRLVDALPKWPLWVPLALVVLNPLIGAVLFAVFAAFGVDVGIDFGKSTPFKEADSHTDSPTWGELLVENLSFVSLIVMAFVFARIKRLTGPLPQRLGLSKMNAKTAIIWTIIAFVVSFGLETLVDQIGPGGPGGEHQNDLFTLKFGLCAMLDVTLAVILAPIAEEILFRGILFAGLARRIGVIAAALVSGTLFGLVHFTNTDMTGMIAIGIGGVVLALLYWRTGSIIPGIILHALNNAIVVASQFDLDTIPSLLVGAGSIPVLLLLTLPFTRIKSKDMIRPPQPLDEISRA